MARNVERQPPESWVPPPRYRRPHRLKADLRFWRLRAEGWTMKQLADEYGVAISTVSRLLTPIERELRRG
jgi:hypothetical protein